MGTQSPGKLGWQAEAREDLRSAERGDSGDASAVQGQHVEGDREVAGLPWAELVGAERQLPAGPCWHVPQA